MPIHRSRSMSPPTQGPKLTPASDAGQKPPTESMPVRQRYQMGCHPGNGGDGSSNSRQPTRSRQFNRGGGGTRSGGGY